MRTSSTYLWIPQKFTCRGCNSWLFNPFSMKHFEDFAHTDSFFLSNSLYFCEGTQTGADVCGLDVYFPCLTLLNQKVLFQTSVIVFDEERNTFECFPLLVWFVRHFRVCWKTVKNNDEYPNLSIGIEDHLGLLEMILEGWSLFDMD